MGKVIISMEVDADMADYIIKRCTEQWGATGGRVLMSLKDSEKSAGEILHDFRVKRGWTQDQLAIISGVCQQNISYYEKGIRKIGLKAARKLGAAFGISPGVFLF